MTQGIVLLLPILFPILAGAFVFKLHNRKHRRIYVSTVMVINALLVFAAMAAPNASITLWKLNDSISILLRVDGMSKFFVSLISVIWTLAAIYAFEYMKHEGNEERYFAFYTMTLGVLVGICFAGNLMTLYMFYEFMTLITVPMVMHSRTKEAIAAGLKYLGYSVFGAGLALVGFFFVDAYSTTTTFTAGGVLDMAKVAGNENTLLIIFLIMMIGFGCKAGMLPLQAWLPTAHPVAPAPASAVLSGIITKAGVFAIIRVTYYLFGTAFLRGTWVQTVMLVLTLATVFVGSMLAYKERLLKKRLAYSTVSQVSYVLFGLMLFTNYGLLGALLQVVFHAIAKNILFLSAGSIIYKTHNTYVDQLKGMGKKMPVVMWCFTIASLSLIGIPPTSGFVSKWFLATGAMTPEFGILGFIGAAVLLISALLTAGYLLPIVADSFFPGSDFDYEHLEKQEPSLFMTIPLVLLSIAAIALGIFPNAIINFISSISSVIL